MSSIGACSSVYRIKYQNCSAGVVEAVLRALDGPQPMRNFKPSERNPNSADQFWQAHQAEYEARGRPGPDPVERVRRHNAAYPVLRDELDKRRSLARVTADNSNKCKKFDSMSKACLKLKGSNRRIKKLNVNSGRRTINRKRLVKIKNRQTANNVFRRKSARYGLKLINQCCQCTMSVVDKKTGSDDIFKFLNPLSTKARPQSTLAPKILEAQIIKKESQVTLSDDIQEANEKPESNTSVVRSLDNPATTDPSVTSYNSFFSLDHEPMVSD